MNRRTFSKSLIKCCLLFDKIGMLSVVKNTSSLKLSDNFKNLMFCNNILYKDLFLEGLKNCDYNFILKDYSYFQFSHMDEDSMPKLRYAFLPNPFNVPTFDEFSEDFAEYDGDMYELYFQYLDESFPAKKIPQIRYDFSPNDYVELIHPASHIHFGEAPDSRFPVDKIISPNLFAVFITKMFFSNKWQSDLNNWYAKEKICCETLEEQFFSVEEKGHLFIA